MSPVLHLVADLAPVGIGGCLAIWSLYAPEGRKRGPGRVVGFALGAAIFVGGIVLLSY